MSSLFIKIAGFVIRFQFKEINQEGVKDFFLDVLERYLGGFSVEPNPKIDYTIEVVQKLNFEFFFQSKHRKNYLLLSRDISSKKILTFYYVSYQQLQLILRTICQKLLTKNKGIILHASASLVNGEARVFLGKSGAGKSTTVKLLSKVFQPLADDIVILKKEGREFYFYQTPFIENNFISGKSLKRYPLGGVYFIKKSSDYSIDKIKDKNKLVKHLLSQLFTENYDQLAQTKYLLSFINNFDNFNYLRFDLEHPDRLINLFTKKGEEQH